MSAASINCGAADDILTIPEVAERLRCSRAHAYHLARGKIGDALPLAVIRLGRRKLVRRSTLDAWMRANERAQAGGILPVSFAVDTVDASRRDD
jgi:excisionase family DNA binding protein